MLYRNNFQYYYESIANTLHHSSIQEHVHSILHLFSILAFTKLEAIFTIT